MGHWETTSTSGQGAPDSLPWLIVSGTLLIQRRKTGCVYLSLLFGRKALHAALHFTAPAGATARRRTGLRSRLCCARLTPTAGQSYPLPVHPTGSTMPCCRSPRLASERDWATAQSHCRLGLFARPRRTDTQAGPGPARARAEPRAAEPLVRGAARLRIGRPFKLAAAGAGTPPGPRARVPLPVRHRHHAPPRPPQQPPLQPRRPVRPPPAARQRHEV
jgi:hypothetical protein